VRADRLLSLVLLLQARGVMTARALAAELRVSVRTVYRDLEALSAARVPVITESGPGGGCRLMDDYRFPLRGLRPQEAEALLILGVPEAVRELGLDRALDAAHRQIRVTAGLAASTLVHLDMPRWFGSQEEVPCLRDLAQALRLGRKLRFRYRHRDGRDDEPRVVGPLGLVNKAGTWYLIAIRPAVPEHQARENGDPAVFRVGRVTSARLLTAEVVRPDGFELAAFWDRWSAAFVTSRSQVEVRVRATATALRIFPYVFGDAGTRAAEAAGPADEDGLREVVLNFEEERVAAHRLAGFGGEVAVISPGAVRTELIATARELLARYAGTGTP
jgi:predicted DNA-binding transcriptional regulator YafY